MHGGSGGGGHGGGHAGGHAGSGHSSSGGHAGQSHSSHNSQATSTVVSQHANHQYDPGVTWGLPPDAANDPAQSLSQAIKRPPVRAMIFYTLLFASFFMIAMFHHNDIKHTANIDRLQEQLANESTQKTESADKVEYNDAQAQPQLTENPPNKSEVDSVASTSAATNRLSPFGTPHQMVLNDRGETPSNAVSPTISTSSVSAGAYYPATNMPPLSVTTREPLSYIPLIEDGR